MKRYYAIAIALCFLYFSVNLIADDVQSNTSLNTPDKTKLTNDMVDVVTKLNDKGYFIENKGQWDNNVLFMAQGKSLRTWITRNSMVLEQFEAPKEEDLRNPGSSTREIKAHAVALEFISPSPVTVSISEPAEMTYNFIIGRDESTYRSGVQLYREVMVKGIYDGIDMRYYFENGEVRYDYIVHPGANPRQIELEIKGSRGNRIENGNLVMETSIEPVVKMDLVAFEKDVNQKKNVDVTFNLQDNRLKFNIGEYNPSKKLIIDPLILLYDLQISDSRGNNSVIYDLVVGDNQELFFCGMATSSHFPADSGSYNGSADIIIGKVIDDNFSLSTEWMTFYGGSNYDCPHEIDLDDDYIYFTGMTLSSDFPLQNEYEDDLLGASNFFTVLNLDGNITKYSTYLGNETNWEINSGIKVANNGNVYLVGSAGNGQSPAFYELNEITSQSPSVSFYYQGIIMGFTPNGSLDYDLIFSSYFGGDRSTEIRDIDIDENENIYITGITRSSNGSFYPTSNSYDETNTAGNVTNFIAKLNFDTNLRIVYNTFFGRIRGMFPLEGSHAIIYRDSTIFIGGSSELDGIPMKNAFDNNFNSTSSEAFVSAIKPQANDTNDLVYSSYFGENSLADIWELEYDESCNTLIFVGQTRDSLKNVQWPVYEHFGDTSRIMVGVVDINQTGIYSLIELAYFGKNMYPDGYTVKCKSEPYNVKVYAGGRTEGVGYNWDMGLYSLTKVSCDTTSQPEPCECPYNIDDWLSLNVSESQNCDSNCYVTHSLNIQPPYTTCFMDNYEVTIKQYGAGEVTFWTGSHFSWQTLDRCILKGSTYEITIKLYESEEDTTPCVINKAVYCPIYEAGDYCYVDCETDIFTQRTPLTFEACPGCWVTVSYGSRIACPGITQRHDIQITQILKQNAQGSPPSSCNNCSDYDIYRACVREIIITNEMGFPPTIIPDCASTWRFSNASCWTSFMDTLYFPRADTASPSGTTIDTALTTVNLPCRAGCCAIYMRVCITRGAAGKSPIWTITPESGVNGFIWCDTTFYVKEGTTDTLSCENNCDILEEIFDVFTYHKLNGEYSQYLPLNENIMVENIRANLSVYNTQEKLIVEMGNSNGNYVDLLIHSINGALLLQRSEKITPGTNQFEIDIASLTSGNYFISVLLDGIPVNSSIFTIVK
jgi:hypothetical protein